MKTVHLDFETFSEADITQVGAYRYARDPSTEIIIACWSLEYGEVRIWQRGDRAPEELNELIEAGAIISAHNAEFEYAILKWANSDFSAASPEQMYDTATQAAVCGLFRSLDGATRALHLPYTKDPRGKKLMRKFSIPDKKTGERTHPEDSPEDWEDYIDYCLADVVAARELYRRLPKLTDAEIEAWRLTQRLNERGVPIDMVSVNQAGVLVSKYEKRIWARCNELTNGIDPTQVARLKKWIGLPNLQKKTIDEALSGKHMFTAAQREVMNIRIEAGRASTKKLQSMARMGDLDCRAQGTLMHYGAHTGRWSGKLIQPHNFIRGDGDLEGQEFLFSLLPLDAVDLFYDRPISAIAEAMRGFICASPGKELMVVDYSAIEARVLAWLVGQEDILALYHQGVDTYVDMASFMFGIHHTDVTDRQRYIGKQTVLGCGYQMGAPRFYEQAQGFGATDVTLYMANRAVESYREKYDRVVKFWYGIQRSALRCVIKKMPVKCRFLKFDYNPDDGDFLTMELPSKRKMYFHEPVVKMEQGHPTLFHTHHNSMKNMSYSRSLFGGLLTENAVQAISADIMRYGMMSAEKGEYPLIMTVHDEAIAEENIGSRDIKEFEKILCTLPPWGKGIPLEAKGFTCKRYRKD